MSGRRTVMRKSNGKGRVYVLRDKKGRFVDVQNIGRASAEDRRKKAKYHPKKRGYGYKGDYKKALW